MSLGRRRPLLAASVLLLLACTPGGAGPQGARTRTPTATRVATTPEIDAPWMIAQVEALSDDALRGRYTLDPETLGRAAEMIAGHHRTLGDAPVGGSYRIPFEFGFGTEMDDTHHVWVETGGPAQPLAEGDATTWTIGRGATVVADVVLVQGPLGKRPRGKAVDVRGHAVLLVDPGALATEEALRARLGELRDAGAKAVLVAAPVEASAIDLAARRRVAKEIGVPALELSPAAVSRLRGRTPDRAAVVRLADVRVSLAPKSREKRQRADNVVAWMEGSERPNEIVVLGAHYDHIGTSEHGLFCRTNAGDGICNGADDNASGTAMVLAIAKAFADAGVKPKRTLVFAHFAGEELGLHGSRALADDPPAAAPFANGRIVAMINFDMVGRLGKDGLSIGGVASSTAWMPLLDRVGTHGLPIVYERSISARSDQASFYAHDVPVLFFFTGLHADYHGPDDEADRLARDAMVDIAELALDLVVALADGEAVPFTKSSGNDGLVGRIPGTDESTVEKRVRARPETGSRSVGSPGAAQRRP